MPRVFIPRDAVQGTVVTVSEARELHHLRDVLRVTIGDRLECVDGEGHTYAGPIRHCSRRKLVMEIREQFAQPLRPVRLTLAQALIRPERFDWVIQKATELGVEAIIPLVTHRTVARPGKDRIEHRRTRWQRIAREAATQCGRTILPRIDTPQGFREAIRSLELEAYVLMPTLAVASRPLNEELRMRSGATTAVVLIGPEGDFTREEVAFAQGHGARPVSLGQLTLRAETAAIVTLSILHYFCSNPV